MTTTPALPPPPPYVTPANAAMSGLFVNSWANFNNGTLQANYYLSVDKTVFVDGVITNSGAIASGSVIATLPSGFRPTATIFRPVQVNSGANATTYVQIDSTGDITYVGALASLTYLTLSLSFRTV